MPNNKDAAAVALLKMGGWKSEMVQGVNPLNLVGAPIGALAAAATPTRSMREVAEADRETWKNVLMPGRGAYNAMKRVGTGLRGEEMQEAREERDYERGEDGPGGAVTGEIVGPGVAAMLDGGLTSALGGLGALTSDTKSLREVADSEGASSLIPGVGAYRYAKRMGSMIRGPEIEAEREALREENRAAKREKKKEEKEAAALVLYKVATALQRRKLQKRANMVGDALRGFAQGTSKAVRGIGEQAQAGLNQLEPGSWSALKDLGGQAGSALKDYGGQIADAGQNAYDSAKDYGQTALKNLQTSSALNKAEEALRNPLADPSTTEKIMAYLRENPEQAGAMLGAGAGGLAGATYGGLTGGDEDGKGRLTNMAGMGLAGAAAGGSAGYGLGSLRG